MDPETGHVEVLSYRLPQEGDAVAGEIPILNVAAAVACAVANATGTRVQQIPLTPRVLDLLCGEGQALDLSHMAEDGGECVGEELDLLRA